MQGFMLFRRICSIEVKKMNEQDMITNGMTPMYPLSYSSSGNVVIPQSVIEIPSKNILGTNKMQIKGEINYEKRNFSFKEFEKILSRDFEFNKISENCYIINGKNDYRDKIVPQKSFGFIPYCLKPLNCMHRLGYECPNFNQEACKNCNARKLIEFYKSRGIPYYHIVRDDEDIPKAIRSYNEQYGVFEAVIVVSCPRAVLENKRFIHKYDVPVIFVSLANWNDCKIKKALQGKWWGETSLDISGLQQACNKCLKRTEKGEKPCVT